MFEVIIPIAIFAILVVVITVQEIYKSVTKAKQKKIDMRCYFTKEETEYIETIMKKYRCEFEELILLGAWYFEENGRDTFDIIDDKRNNNTTFKALNKIDFNEIDFNKNYHKNNNNNIPNNNNSFNKNNTNYYTDDISDEIDTYDKVDNHKNNNYKKYNNTYTSNVL